MLVGKPCEIRFEVPAGVEQPGVVPTTEPSLVVAQPSVQRDVGTDSPLILYVGVVLMSACVDRSIARIPIRIRVEVGVVALGDGIRNAGKVYNRLLQPGDVLRVRGRRFVGSNLSRNIRKPAWVVCAVEKDLRHEGIAAEKSPAVVMDVETEVEPGSESMSPMAPGD